MYLCPCGQAFTTVLNPEQQAQLQATADTLIDEMITKLMDLTWTLVNGRGRKCGQTSEQVKHKTAKDHHDRAARKGTMHGGKK